MFIRSCVDTASATQIVCTAAAFKRVIARGPDKCIVTGQPANDIVLERSCKPIIMLGRGKVLKSKDVLIPVRPSPVSVGRHAVLIADVNLDAKTEPFKRQGIDAGTTIILAKACHGLAQDNQIISGFTPEPRLGTTRNKRVISRTAPATVPGIVVEIVVSVTDMNVVVARFTVEAVAPTSTQDYIILRAAINDVVAGATFEPVKACTAIDRIIAGPANENVVAAFDVDSNWKLEI